MVTPDSVCSACGCLAGRGHAQTKDHRRAKAHQALTAAGFKPVRELSPSRRDELRYAHRVHRILRTAYQSPPARCLVRRANGEWYVHAEHLGCFLDLVAVCAEWSNERIGRAIACAAETPAVLTATVTLAQFGGRDARGRAADFLFSTLWQDGPAQGCEATFEES